MTFHTDAVNVLNPYCYLSPCLSENWTWIRIVYPSLTFATKLRLITYFTCYVRALRILEY